jgi:bifunctional non-homologous end joining protein LigD
MMATLSARREFEPGWLFEPKLDGVRVVAYVRGGTGGRRAEVRLLSRNRKSLDGAYPEIGEALAGAARAECIVDGEVVALRGGVSSFSLLQQRIGLRDPAKARASGVRVWYYAFDLLWLEGEDLRSRPLRERKRLLRTALAARPPLRFTAHRTGEADALFAAACRRGLEGLIAKRADAPYESGRSESWLKLKCVNEQEFVVGGWTEPQGSRVGLGALLVGYHDGRGALRYAGKVGTGYDAAALARLRGRLVRLAAARSPFADHAPERPGLHWVRPELVAQIGFAEWTAKGLLRQPRYLGLRDDKPAAAVVREVAKDGTVRTAS